MFCLFLLPNLSTINKHVNIVMLTIMGGPEPADKGRLNVVS